MGKFNTHGGYFAPEGYFRINEGGSHEENPNGGVQVGVDQEGTPNMLEEGEPVYNDYVYSDNITAEKDILEKYNIPAKYAGKLYSKIADAFVDEAEDRPNDPISNNGLNAMLVRLADAQEEQKAIAQQKELEEQLANMTPEELDALEAMLSDQEAAEQQAAQEQVMQEQAMAEQQATPEEQAMAAQQMQAPVQEVPQQPIMACGGKITRKYAPGGLLIDPPTRTVVTPQRDNTATVFTGTSTGLPYEEPVENRQPGLLEILGDTLDGKKSVTLSDGTEAPVVGGAGLLGWFNPAKLGKVVVGAAKGAAQGVKAAKATKAANGVNKAADVAKAGANTVDKNKLLKEAYKRSAEAGKESGHFWTKDYWHRLPEHSIGEEIAANLLPGHNVWRHIRRANSLGKTGWNKVGRIGFALGEEGLRAKLGIGGYGLLREPITSGVGGAYDYVSDNADYARNTVMPPAREVIDTGIDYSDHGDRDYALGGNLGNYFPEGGLIPGVHNIPSWYVLNKADGKYYDPEVLAREQAIAQSVNAPAVITVNRSRGTTGSSNTRNVGNIRSTRMQPIDASIMGGMAYKVNPNAAVVAPAPTGELSSITIQDTVPDYVTWRGIGEQFGMTPNWYRQGWVKSDNSGYISNPDNYVMRNGYPAISGRSLKDFEDNPNVNPAPTTITSNTPQNRVDPLVKNISSDTPVVINNTKPSTSIGMNQAAMNLVNSPYLQISKTGDPITLADMANVVAANNKPSTSNKTAKSTNSPSTTTKQTTERPLYPTWMRYAGLANALGDMAWNLAQKPDRYHINPYRPVLPEGRMDLIDPIFNPIDENMAVNDLLASNAGTVYGLRNSGVGPSLGANLLAADYNAGRNMGAARTQIWDANNQRRNQIIAQRNQNAQALGQFRYGINRDRANYINQAALQNQHYSLLQQRLNNAAEQEKWDAFNTSKDALAKGLSNIGLENMRLNNANDLYDYVRLPDGRMAYVPKMNTAKCGGKMSKKTKK